MASLSVSELRRRSLTLAPALLLLATPLLGQAPPPVSAGPGGTVARGDSPWAGIENPAAIGGYPPTILVSYAPPRYGIKGLSHGAIFVTTTIDSVPLLTGLSALSFGPFIDARFRLSIARRLTPTMSAGASLSLRVLAVGGYPTTFLPHLDLGFLVSPLPWLSVAGTATNVTGSTVPRIQPEQGMRLALAANLDSVLRFSVDALHELRRPTSLAVRLTWFVDPATELCIGVGLYPIGVSAGFSLRMTGAEVDAKLAYVAPVGFATVAGVAVPLQSTETDEPRESNVKEVEE